MNTKLDQINLRLRQLYKDGQVSSSLFKELHREQLAEMKGAFGEKGFKEYCDERWAQNKIPTGDKYTRRRK